MVVSAARADDGRVLRNVPVAALCLAAIVFGACAAPSLGATHSTAFADRVTHICTGAVLFEDSHEIGTRAGAVAVSRDIRETGARRLRRVAAVPEPHPQAQLIRRWLDIEHRLVAAYARNYLLIWNAIEDAKTPAQLAALPARVHTFVHDPDRLKGQADGLELRLHVPDCTGGGY
jgi:hypothetical protein